LFVDRRLCSRWLLGSGRRFIGFGGAGVVCQGGGGAGVIVLRLVCIAVIGSGELLGIEGVSQLLDMRLGREFREFVFILVCQFVVGDTTG